MVLLALLVLFVAATFWRGAAREAATLRGIAPSGAFMTMDGTRLHYLQVGAGPDLVLIHGSSGNIRDFDFGLLDTLAKSYRVTAFDRPGLGFSGTIADPSIAAQLHLIQSAAAELGIRNPIVVGQSYGGTLALEWGLQGGPAALVLVSSPALPWPGDLGTYYKVMDTWAGRLIVPWLAAAWLPAGYVETAVAAAFAPDAAPPDYAARMGSALTTRAGSLRANADQVNALRAQLVQMQVGYPGLTLPIELLHGDADTTVPLHIHAQPLSVLLPNATLTVLPGIGHMPHHAALPQVLAAIDRAAARAGLRQAPLSP